MPTPDPTSPRPAPPGPATAPCLPARRALLGVIGGLGGLGVLGTAGGLAALPAGARAQAAAFPQRPLTLLVPFAPGGIADLTARALGQGLAAELGQAVVVDNRPGAGSIHASQAVAQAAPDGHTLLLMSNGHAVAPALFRQLPYDAQRDFAPVCLLARFDLALFVPAASPLRSLADLLARARAAPGRLTLGTVAAGSTQHLAAHWLLQRAGVDALVVPYKATPALLGALRGGEVDAAIEILGPWLGQLAPAGEGGAGLRALAVAAAQRHPYLPAVPTVAEAGGAALAGYDVSSWNALAAPARTPAAVLARLNQAANAALARPAVQRQLRTLGVRLAGGSAEDLRRHLAAETARWAAVARAAKIEAG